MKKISKEQRKIIYISGAIIVFLILLLLLVYIPQKNRLQVIKSKLAMAENEIAEINSFSKGKSLPEALRFLNLHLRTIPFKLPEHEEVVVKCLSEEARKLKLEVHDISFSEKTMLLDKIPGYEIEELQITIKLTGGYKALGEYLYNLRNNFPVLIRLRQVNIQGGGEGQFILNISLQISAYLSNPK
ncbi:MAG: hypothetical protein PHO70_02755 [Candidatus Omnitrophica bacterium]|nr:hypothetical protein [Candidatus Omnitrophota bacterium]